MGNQAKSFLFQSYINNFLFHLPGASNSNADYCAIDSQHTMCGYTVEPRMLSLQKNKTNLPSRTGNVFIKTKRNCMVEPRRSVPEIVFVQGPSDECTGKTILRGMTEAGKVAILEKHNELRRRWSEIDQKTTCLKQSCLWPLPWPWPGSWPWPWPSSWPWPRHQPQY